MPRPVMAAALFFNGSLMFVAGIQIVASRPITRASLIVGFSILGAVGVGLSDFKVPHGRISSQGPRSQWL